jgi:Cys-tRNA(Pro) deacylase
MTETREARSPDEGSRPNPAAEEPLRRAGVDFEIAPLVEGARSLIEFAQKSGLTPNQVLKSLLLDVDGERYAMLLLPGDREADFAALRRRFSARSVRLADREVVERITGYRIGTVTPLGMRTEGLPILLDAAALTAAILSLGTGRPGRHVRLAPQSLVQALSAETGNFSRPGRE